MKNHEINENPCETMQNGLVPTPFDPNFDSRALEEEEDDAELGDAVGDLRVLDDVGPRRAQDQTDKEKAQDRPRNSPTTSRKRLFCSLFAAAVAFRGANASWSGRIYGSMQLDSMIYLSN